jgi:hypothetical protein
VQELARLVPALWPLRLLPPAARAQLTADEEVPVWAALALAAVVIASGGLLLRVGREAWA